MDIDPNVALTEALAPALTTDDFLEQRLETWDLRIQADPTYAENHVSRAVVLLATHDYDRARQAINHCVTHITDPNDPALHAIDYWADMYHYAERHTEAEIWSLHKARLLDRFPGHSKETD